MIDFFGYATSGFCANALECSKVHGMIGSDGSALKEIGIWSQYICLCRGLRGAGDRAPVCCTFRDSLLQHSVSEGVSCATKRICNDRTLDGYSPLSILFVLPYCVDNPREK